MPMRSKYPDVKVPNVDLWDFLFENPSRPYRDDKVLFRDTESADRFYTYSSLRGTALGFGRALRNALGWQKGDVLLIYSPDDIDYPAVVFGTLWTGGVVSTANPGYTIQELSGQLDDCGAKAIVTQEPFLKVALQAARKSGIPEDRVILMGPKPSKSSATHFQSLKGYRISQPQQRVPRPYEINPDKDLSFLVYSSGTTGKPKGVMLSHTNMVAVVLMWGPGNGLNCGDGTNGSGDRSLAFIPFFHIYGLMAEVLLSTSDGLEVFVMPSFDLQKFCSTIQREKITYSNVVPRVVLALAKEPVVDKYNLTSLRMMCSAAAPLSKDLIEMMYARLKVPIRQAYGMSEMSPATHRQEWDEWNLGMGSIGRPVANVEAKVVSIDAGTELGPGEVGELWVRGPNMFQGYLNNEAATTEAIALDGWYKTGDVGYVDENGLLYITDRIKELIKYNGFQVAPAELEGVLTSLPNVKDAAVIGIYRKDLETEVPRAYVVLESGVQANQRTAEEIESVVRSRLSRHKWLRGGVRFIDVIPASASGKILRRELKVMAQSEQSAGSPKL